MTMMKLTFTPGIFRDATRYGASGGWWDGDNVRFRLGRPETIGGWEKIITTPYLGTCRLLYEWNSLSTDVILAVGTHLKFYAVSGGAYYDITPIRLTVALGPNIITSDTTTNNVGANTTVVSIAHNSHGAIANDYVTITGATTFNGIDATAINLEHAITSITDGNNYKITLTEQATSSSAGGGSPTFVYQINVGIDTTTTGTGWGAGPWGGDYLGAGANTGWGDAANTSVAGQQIGLWSAWNYGEDLLFCRRNSAIYYWDWSDGYAARGETLHSQSGASYVPTLVTEVTVSSERHIIAFGCDPFTAIGSQDKALIRWSSKESLVDWLPLNTNSAGDLRLIIGSTFVTQVQTSQEILVWSNAALHSMRYVGAPFYYGISVISAKAVICGPKSKAVLDDVVYWMGRANFYRYTGRAEILPCTVQEYVFSNINYNETYKIYAGTNNAFNEVMWFYCSEASSEVDRCVIYNTVDNAWYYGTLSRTAWMDRVSSYYPTAAASDNYLYHHEDGINDGSGVEITPVSSYIESAPIELGDGDDFMFVNRFIPDVTFRNSDAISPSVTITLTPQDWPGGALGPTTTSSGAITGSTTVTVERFTDRLDVRLRGRMLTFKIESASLGTSWRLGVPRLEGKVDGKK